MEITCEACGVVTGFEQPYAYHAGFANQGFLYNEEGNLTLVWSSFDPAYENIAGKQHPWTLTEEQMKRVEDNLALAPSGGRWLFINPARCPSCYAPISAPMTETIYYLNYPGSLLLDEGPSCRGFSEALK